MCGILFTLTSAKKSAFVDGNSFISSRGPDSIQEFKFQLENDDVNAVGASSVLHLRGPLTVSQPLQSTRFCLQWNGEIFDFNDSCDKEHLLEGNDTQFLFKKVTELPEESFNEELVQLMGKIHGPWAFVLVDKLSKKVYFGRDCFGRRSLTFRFNSDQKELVVASCSIDSGLAVTEADAGVIHCFSLDDWSIAKVHIQTNWTICSTVPILNSSALIERAWCEFEGSVCKRILHLPSDKGISILFSGGVDSMLIAVACARILQREDGSSKSKSIGLVNVAFEHPGLLKQLNLTTPDASYWQSIPDRQTGLEAFCELRRLFPPIGFCFQECNVSRKEYDESRLRIMKLMAPNDTVMDLSLAMVIWHGSQCARKISTEAEESCAGAAAVQTAVLLCGMGADEQLGGYSRHRSLHQDPLAFRAELQLDLDRISTRNLGRDDRCIGDAGLEGRFPFLDEEFVGFVCRDVPLEAKIDKWLIREMLRSSGVSVEVAGKPKKAMQFGAKSAKIETTQCSGTDKLHV